MLIHPFDDGEKELCDIHQAPSGNLAYDLVALGFWLHEADDAVGHPDDQDIAELKATLKKTL